ncbi:MAG TPA: antitoxin Xre/MbcA/ParS toxin-binding domain-containing protein, partial [Bryobacteraceae bacterium]|nr:antitoxin Xre/MbcA/ParS toxin-binding domain-containing protein [Bryobacteraceae bacterium]
WRYNECQMTSLFDLELKRLGGERGLGRRVRHEADLSDAIRDGFSSRVLDSLMQSSGLSLKEIADSVGLPVRTLQRHKSEGRFDAAESDRLYRLAHILAMAERYLGDRERALKWIRYPIGALGGTAPLQFLDTEPGTRIVEQILGRIAYGGIS